MVKNIYRYISLLIVAILVACGNSPKLLEEDQLERIITQAMLTTAILEKDQTNIDTFDVYAPILDKEGVTMADVKYTIDEMAGRKSNPLNNLFTKINENIVKLTAEAVYKFTKKQKFDTIALRFAADTLWQTDTMIKGNPEKFKYEISPVKDGTYQVTFNYRSHPSYDVGVPMFKVKLVGKDISHDRSSWINRANIEQQFINKIEINNSNYDTITLGFTKPAIKKGLRISVDSSYITDFVVVYTPPVKKARKDYFEHITNFKFESYEGFKNDSLYTRFGWRRDTTRCGVAVPRIETYVDSLPSTGDRLDSMR